MHTRNKTQIRSPHPPQAVPLLRWRRLTMMPFVNLTVENLGENHGLITLSGIISWRFKSKPSLVREEPSSMARPLAVDEENRFGFCFGRAFISTNNHFPHCILYLFPLAFSLIFMYNRPVPQRPKEFNAYENSYG